MSEVIVDLAAHSIDLLRHRRSEIKLTGSFGAFCFICKDRKRRLQPVGQISGFRHSSSHCVLTLIEQRIQIIDERLDLCGVGTVNAPIATRVQARQARPQAVDWRHAAAHLQEPCGQAEDTERQHERLLKRTVNGTGYRHASARMRLGDGHESRRGHDYQSDAPQGGAEQDPASQRQ